MQVEVYPTDADAVDAAAALVAECVREAVSRGRARVALGGGRSSRATLVALASRGDLPWGHVDWCLADERCGEPGDTLAHAKVARDSLFGPRGVAAAHIRGPVVGDRADAVAAGYAESLSQLLGHDGRFDVVVLGIGPDGALGVLPPGCAALEATSLVAVVGAAGTEPPRVTLTPQAWANAAHVIVTAVGPETATAVAGALRDGTGPAARVLPSDRVTWIVDREAAGLLLATAIPADRQPVS